MLTPLEWLHAFFGIGYEFGENAVFVVMLSIAFMAFCVTVAKMINIIGRLICIMMSKRR